MRVLSVNVGREEPIAGAKSSGKTGIFKHPVNTPVSISANGLAGDEISDKENHGGVDQAVYLFGSPDYEWWSQELDRELEPGTFGENLVISGLESAGMCVGDRFLIGRVVLEVTAPRIPCVTLAVRMGEPAFLKRFRRAERPGLYCRVIRPGEVSAGDPVRLEPYTGVRVPVIEVFRAFFDPDPGETVLRRHLASPLALRARKMDEERLEHVLERDEQARSII